MVSVLVVDDDAFTRSTVRHALGGQGHEVVAALDGTAALGWLRQERAQVDVVITDIMMPDTDGLELIRQIHKAWPDLPIIAMSSGGNVVKINYLKAAREFGAQEVLYKPCAGRALAAAIERALAGGADGNGRAPG